MNDRLLKLSVSLKTLLHSEEGQDLIEYALLAAIIALGATAGMARVALDLNIIFLYITAKFLVYTVL